jgi:integrase
VDGFVSANCVVQEFLNQYEKGGVSYGEKAVGLARFFRWLKVVKNLDLNPGEFLDLHLKRRNAERVDERRWALSLALEYSRDNPDLKVCAQQYRYSAFFLPVKLFCDANEAPLTTRNGFFPKRGRRKYQDRPFTVDFVRKILGLLNERDRAICLVQLQSGQSIKQVLVDINRKCDYVFGEIDAGKKRIKFEFSERKGNGFNYFSFIGQDAIQQLQKWRVIREKLLRDLEMKSEYLFITKSGEPLDCKTFHNNFRLLMISHDLYKTPYAVRRHGFRKFFEQEASPPERGISKSYVSFMMGHSRGSGEDHKLDVVGGVYDAAPSVYPDVVEKEYAKLEPYLNVYSGHAADSQFSDTDRKVLDLLGDPDVLGFLKDMVKKRRGTL